MERSVEQVKAGLLKAHLTLACCLRGFYKSQEFLFTGSRVHDRQGQQRLLRDSFCRPRADALALFREGTSTAARKKSLRRLDCYRRQLHRPSLFARRWQLEWHPDKNANKEGLPRVSSGHLHSLRFCRLPRKSSSSFLKSKSCFLGPG
ncbi:unnamed protein product [Symbiodinium natans]|uniref:Uncharacterized protein n=1 Tax=Symbiodinium natans TaxID=878477 RepID=A0A812N9Z1_9DINO|nr:unnamed protein product [Symbiodinium natans]